MITYKSLMTKDDALLMRVCRRVMNADDFSLAIDESAKTYRSTYDTRNGTRAPGIAKRSANQVMLAALSRYGVTDWRNVDTKTPPPKLTQPSGFQGYQPDNVKNRKYNSGDGLWSRKV